MKDGFIKVASGTVEISVADVKSNVIKIREQIKRADELGVNLLVLPELCVTGYTCGDLFLSEKLINESHAALTELCAYTCGKYPVVIVGMPFRLGVRLYNCAAVMQNGKLLGLVPKTFLPDHGEFCEGRYFTPAGNETAEICGQTVPVTADIVFQNKYMPEFTFGVEICEDLWGTATPSQKLCRAGASVIANCSASNEAVGKAYYKKNLVSNNSARLLCGYVYADADYSESTQDMVFSRHLMIAENGKLLAENKPFGENTLILSEIDVRGLCGARIRNTSFTAQNEFIKTVTFEQELRDTEITRHIDKNPFIPKGADMSARAEDILQIQSFGLKKRLEHTNAKCAVIGISGGLDSTLALLVAVRAMKLCGRPLSDIKAVTIPCFGTTARTKSNAVMLCELLGVSLSEINITGSVLSHFEDIGQDPSQPDVTFENAQARERTQVLMDIANKQSGLVIGTGDLSELALGWATYNGDHMSMYGVNAGVPKTLVRHVVRYEAEHSEEALRAVLLDILDTPVSPELLPTDENGQMQQKTEDLVGPYELHDFFLYHTVRLGQTPKKIYRLAKIAFDGEYSPDTILHWLSVFTRRFFNQQFKRSCLPDGPKVGSVSLSPRGDFKMPTDASAKLWLAEIENLKNDI